MPEPPARGVRPGPAIRAYARARMLLVAAGERLREPRGQTMTEYMGVLLIVSVIVVAVATTDIGHEITRKITELVRDISGNNTDSRAKR